jgi:hypothetical protein
MRYRNSYRTLSSAQELSLGWVVILVLGCADTVAVPFVLNQNQYLAHALASYSKSIDGDWLVGTVDPYPVFTVFACSILYTFDVGGVRAVALLGTIVALLGVYRLAGILAPSSCQRSIALSATVIVGASLFTAPYRVPLVGGGGSAFMGLAGQYIISKPAYMQPSMFGCLVLLSFPFWLTAMQSPTSANRRNFVLALALTVCGCMLHPTYMVAVGFALIAAFLSDAWQLNWSRTKWYALIGVTVAVSTVAANPPLLTMSSGSAEFAWALQRFAFERIPHHTIWTRWSATDLSYIVLILSAAVVIAWRRKNAWLARWLLLALGIGLFSAALVPILGSAKLALLFPWRLSVFLVPISATVLAVEVAVVINLWSGDLLRWSIVILAFVLGFLGSMRSLRAVSPATADAATLLVRTSHVSGVGLVPLYEENVRLNAGVRIYVDWKSPPYTSEELIEWWKRVDRVRVFMADTETFCGADWGKGIDWIVLTSRQHVPTCVANWLVSAQSQEWRILTRP